MSRPRAGRPRDPEVDARIVAATRALLDEGGLDAVSIAAVAERAGVGRPAVYRRWPDRETLALTVLHDDLGAAVARVEIPEDAPVLEVLVGLVRPLFAYYAAHPASSLALLRLAMFSEVAERGRLDVQLLGFLGDVGARLEAARDRGELAEGVDIPSFVSTFFSVYLMTALGGAKGMIPGVEAQVAVFRGVMAQHLAGAARR